MQLVVYASIRSLASPERLDFSHVPSQPSVGILRENYCLVVFVATRTLDNISILEDNIMHALLAMEEEKGLTWKRRDCQLSQGDCLNSKQRVVNNVWSFPDPLRSRSRQIILGYSTNLLSTCETSLPSWLNAPMRRCHLIGASTSLFIAHGLFKLPHVPICIPNIFFFPLESTKSRTNVNSKS